MPHRRELIPYKDGTWFARVAELPGSMTEGDSREHAFEMLDDAMRSWISDALEAGDPIPPPSEETTYSGKFQVRIPPSLHCRSGRWRFEERREAAALLGPRHDDLLDAVRLTVDSRNLRADEELVLAEVQMPPAARARVVLACRLAADRVARGSIMNHEDFDELLSNVQLAIDQTPRRLDSKNGCVKLEIKHP